MRPLHGLRVDQFAASIAVGDAISDHCFSLQAQLRKWGAHSSIYVRHLDERLVGRVNVWTDYRRPGGPALVLYHFGISSELTPWMLDRLDQDIPVVLIYHNVTPAHYVEGYNPELAQLLRQGRAELPLLRSRVILAAGDSEYNRLELEELGYEQTCVLPILLNTQRLDHESLPAITARYRRTTNLLFVGRITPNKRQDDLIRLYAHYRSVIDPHSRLILVGSARGMEVYLQQLQRLAANLGVADGVDFVGHVTDRELASYYRVAHLFISMSEHEGFGVPLVESMYMGVPIVARAATAVPWTLGSAGALVKRLDIPVVAELIHLMSTDVALRTRIIHSQRARYAALTPVVVAEQYLSKLLRLRDTAISQPQVGEVASPRVSIG
jgi:L-malate glycosyltransferase